MAESGGQAADYTRAAGELVAAGPEGTGRAPETSMRSVVRTSLLRLLKPYTAYQRMVDERVLAAVDELDARVASLERVEPLVDSVLEALDATRARVQQAEESLQRLGAFYDPNRSLPYMAPDSPFELRDEPVAGTVMGYVGGSQPVAETQEYRAFVDTFRGPESRVRELQAPYVELLGGRQPVLDAGCGRGEFLDLLNERGIRATGVDIDPGMVEHCHAKGHEVVQADLNDHLDGLPEGELGAVFSAQVIEHISYPDLMRFLRRSREKLQPGGLFVAETVNPHAPQAFKTFWVDPTHRYPIFPEVALALCRTAGYESAYVFHADGSGDVERDRYTSTAYAVVATK